MRRGIEAQTRTVDGRAGFTLMEVLIAAALSSVIMIALFGVFNAVVDVSIGVKAHEDAAYGERTFESILFDDLRSVFKADGADFSFVGKGGSFLGEDGLLMGFCSSASLGSTGTGPSFSLQRVEYLLKGGNDAKDLCRRQRSYCGIKGDWDWVEVPVLRGVSDMEVEYLDPLDDSFVSEWGGQKRFPKAVKVTVTYIGNREHVFMVDLSLMASGAV